MKAQVHSEKIKGDFIHMVFFWLKNPENQKDRSLFEQAIRKLIRTNPQAIANHIGCPAASEERAVVDNSFTYCYTMCFLDLEAQNAYQTDPTHIAFIEEAKSLWDKAFIYDSSAI